MENFERNVYDLIPSMIFLAAYICVLIFFIFKTKRKSNSKGIKFLPVLLIGLSVFCFRKEIADELMIVEGAKIAEEGRFFFNLIETLRTFVLDGSYEKVILATAKMFNSSAAVIYGSVLFVLAPVTGGALIIEVVASIYPRLRLFLCNWLFVWKEMHYFSELNERSLALAKSIRTSKNVFTRRGIVFTDVYTDSEERITELYLGAKSIGAICISDDLLHTKIRTFGIKKIYLMDNNEINNLQALSALVEGNNTKCLENAVIYLFNSNDTFALAGCNIKEQLSKKEFRKTPNVVPVNGKRNLVRNLFYQLPLYEPLVGKTGKRELNLTIMGVGEIGTEAFLSAYWYGQMLDRELSINVVSKETEEEFRKKIDYINPEILMSATSCDLLKIYPDKDIKSKPYFKFRYYNANLRNDNLDRLLHTPDSEGFKLASTDYFVIALGSDEDNLSVADEIKRIVSLYNLGKSDSEKCIISYVIYDSELCKVLNGSETGAQGIYMHAFGALDEVYNKSNIFMIATSYDAENVGKSYDSIKQTVTDKAKLKGKDFYSYWSDIARAAHIKYKVFSAGLVTASVFDQEDYNKNQVTDLSNYKTLIEKDKSLADKLAWLEHRRWNAYMRSCGMRKPDDFTVYSKKTDNHKSLELKLHPCIVECDMNGMKPHLFSNKVEDDFDMLDMVSRDIHFKLYKNNEDYKKYDYPQYDF